MKRRNFIALSATTPIILNTYLNAIEVDEQIWITIEKVQNVLFPKNGKMPSAKQFGSVEYLKQNINHQTFDKDDLELILNGANVFAQTFPEFNTLNKDEKLKIVNEANETEYGNRWLTILVSYGIEAMLSDPIYGGNKFQSGWMALNHKSGSPRPKKKYGAKINV